MKLHSRFRSICAAALLGTTAAASAPVMATNEAMLDLLKALYENGQITAEQYELISNAAKADAEKTDSMKAEAKQVAEKAARKVDEKIAEMPKITTDGKLVVESADGDWSFQPIGRIFWDQIWTDDDGSTSEGSGTELRRARMGFEATFMKYFEGKVEVDFADITDLDWKDVWIAYVNKNRLGKYNLKVGQQHVPFGHATISSSKYMPLMRRPLFADGPTPARQVGISFWQQSDAENRWFLHTGVYHTALPGAGDGDNVNDSSSGTDEQVVAAIRIGGTPLYRDKKHMLHIGGSYMWQNMNGTPLSYLDNALITHMGSGGTLEANFGSDADELNAYDFEVIGIWGPFHAVG
ncbi:MAG TPA: porin, partial [Gammaproteobacteria bacterium]|nr:porin [Gammaproteobacteria bacterium]